MTDLIATITGIAALLASANTSAADAAGNYAVWGIGQASCNQFARAYEASALTDYKTYLSGYLTAYNTATAGIYQATGTNALSDNMKLVNAYCEQNRMDSFERAIQGALLQDTKDPLPGQETKPARWGQPPAPEAP
jgi:hypothetical protein